MNFPNQNKKILEKILPGFNSDAEKTTLRDLRNFKTTLPLFKLFENLSPFLCHFVTYSRKYYESFSRLRRNIKIDRLPVQTFRTLGQV